MIKTLVIDLDNTLIFFTSKSNTDRCPTLECIEEYLYNDYGLTYEHSNSYQCIIKDRYCIFINHVLVKFIEKYRNKGTKIILWTAVELKLYSVHQKNVPTKF